MTKFTILTILKHTALSPFIMACKSLLLSISNSMLWVREYNQYYRKGLYFLSAYINKFLRVPDKMVNGAFNDFCSFLLNIVQRYVK